jgi:hypothetical protein
LKRRLERTSDQNRAILRHVAQAMPHGILLVHLEEAIGSSRGELSYRAKELENLQLIEIVPLTDLNYRLHDNVLRVLGPNGDNLLRTMLQPPPPPPVTPKLEKENLPTFEIGSCTEGSPLEMDCTGEIVGGLEAATRLVEEIEWDTASSDPQRFDVRVTGIERHRDYLANIEHASGREVEERHRSRKALRDWEERLSIFITTVKFVLWNEVFREKAEIRSAEGAAETICGLSERCFGRPNFPVEWWLWYEGEQETPLVFGVTRDIEEHMQKGYYEGDLSSPNRPQGLNPHRAYEPLVFAPSTRNWYVFSHLLIFVAHKKAEGVSRATLDKYLDITQWRWSVSDPRKFKLR